MVAASARVVGTVLSLRWPRVCWLRRAREVVSVRPRIAREGSGRVRGDEMRAFYGYIIVADAPRSRCGLVVLVVYLLEATTAPVQLQAYFLKNPGNFGPLFLKTLHCAAPLSGMGQHHYHTERGPRRVF